MYLSHVKQQIPYFVSVAKINHRLISEKNSFGILKLEFVKASIGMNTYWDSLD